MDDKPGQNEGSLNPEIELENLEGHRAKVFLQGRRGGLPQITVLLVEDHTIMLDGLRALLKSDQKISIVGEARHGRQALEMVRSSKPDVVLMDIAMPRLNGLEATRQILKESPQTKVIILSSYCDDRYVQQALDAGAAGYLDKGTAAEELLAVLRVAKTRTGLFSQAVARILQSNKQKGFLPKGNSGKRGTTLTPRELEVLQLIAEGYANKQTAAELSISIKTVEKHRQSIMDKLSIHQTAGLTRYAISAGIVENRDSSM
ncbi:MAG: degU 2, partial [Chthoniobacteraceae bacterium]|nr:degU 2 [Chthoniobacteraceae bacterium]